MGGGFEWDEAKAASNLDKHGISFDEAVTVFDDPRLLTDYDAAHSVDEDRWFSLGFSAKGRLLVVWYTERGDATRIIGCRTATRAEQTRYVNS